jgi:hypothetical protein
MGETQAHKVGWSPVTARKPGSLPWLPIHWIIKCQGLSCQDNPCLFADLSIDKLTGLPEVQRPPP